MFCLIGLYADPGSMTLKVEPDRGVELVREHPAISPGYHTNKRHWITVELDGTVEDDLLRELIEDSYDLVVSTLTARARFDVDPTGSRSRSAADLLFDEGGLCSLLCNVGVPHGDHP